MDLLCHPSQDIRLSNRQNSLNNGKRKADTDLNEENYAVDQRAVTYGNRWKDDSQQKSQSTEQKIGAQSQSIGQPANTALPNIIGLLSEMCPTGTPLKHANRKSACINASEKYATAVPYRLNERCTEQTLYTDERMSQFSIQIAMEAERKRTGRLVQSLTAEEKRKLSAFNDKCFRSLTNQPKTTEQKSLHSLEAMVDRLPSIGHDFEECHSSDYKSTSNRNPFQQKFEEFIVNGLALSGQQNNNQEVVVNSSQIPIDNSWNGYVPTDRLLDRKQLTMSRNYSPDVVREGSSDWKRNNSATNCTNYVDIDCEKLLTNFIESEENFYKNIIKNAINSSNRRAVSPEANESISGHIFGVIDKSSQNYTDIHQKSRHSSGSNGTDMSDEQTKRFYKKRKIDSQLPVDCQTRSSNGNKNYYLAHNNNNNYNTERHNPYEKQMSGRLNKLQQNNSGIDLNTISLTDTQTDSTSRLTAQKSFVRKPTENDSMIASTTGPSVPNDGLRVGPSTATGSLSPASVIYCGENSGAKQRSEEYLLPKDGQNDCMSLTAIESLEAFNKQFVKNYYKRNGRQIVSNVSIYEFNDFDIWTELNSLCQPSQGRPSGPPVKTTTCNTTTITTTNTNTTTTTTAIRNANQPLKTRKLLSDVSSVQNNLIHISAQKTTANCKPQELSTESEVKRNQSNSYLNLGDTEFALNLNLIKTRDLRRKPRAYLNAFYPMRQIGNAVYAGPFTKQAIILLMSRRYRQCADRVAKRTERKRTRLVEVTSDEENSQLMDCHNWSIALQSMDFSSPLSQRIINCFPEFSINQNINCSPKLEQN